MLCYSEGMSAYIPTPGSATGVVWESMLSVFTRNPSSWIPHADLVDAASGKGLTVHSVESFMYTAQKYTAILRHGTKSNKKGAVDYRKYKLTPRSVIADLPDALGWLNYPVGASVVTTPKPAPATKPAKPAPASTKPTPPTTVDSVIDDTDDRAAKKAAMDAAMDAAEEISPIDKVCNSCVPLVVPAAAWYRVPGRKVSLCADHGDQLVASKRGTKL